MLEFEEPDGGRVLPLALLRAGATYGVVLTTGGGLCRYRLGDLVRCPGRCGRTPALEFFSRLGGGVDFVGEKLTQETAERALLRLERPGPVVGGMARYRAELLRRGMKAGDVKALPLHAGDCWGGVFGARWVREGRRPPIPAPSLLHPGVPLQYRARCSPSASSSVRPA